MSATTKVLGLALLLALLALWAKGDNCKDCPVVRDAGGHA